MRVIRLPACLRRKKRRVFLTSRLPYWAQITYWNFPYSNSTRSHWVLSRLFHLNLMISRRGIVDIPPLVVQWFSILGPLVKRLIPRNSVRIGSRQVSHVHYVSPSSQLPDRLR